jgi:hypothetical protein
MNLNGGINLDLQSMKNFIRKIREKKFSIHFR